MGDNLESTRVMKKFSLSNVKKGPDQQEMISLMQSILSNKPLSVDDITSLPDAQKELSRIRKLLDNYKNSNKATTTTTNGGAKVDKKELSDLDELGAKKNKKHHGRNAIHEEENINDYVKTNVDKSDTIRQVIYDAIKLNVLFESNTDEDELMEIIDVFEPCTFNMGDVVIQQGERGDDFYVVETGELSITVRMGQEEGCMDASVNEVKVGTYTEGSAFGELALIYGSPRAATIRATSDNCKLWRIKRSWYRGVVGQHRKKLHLEKLHFLPKVNVGKNKFKDVFTAEQLDSMAQLLKQEHFRKGDTIVREGEAGNTFYIIQSGEVDVYRRGLSEDGKPIATLGKEKFFGEKALLSDDVRQATVVASTSKVVCYVMTRGDFTRVLGDLQDILDGNVQKTAVRASQIVQKEKVTYKLDQLEVLNVLGEGGFGKVKLVKANDTGECYALKAQGKKFIIDHGQKRYIQSELRLLKMVKHPNILMLHCAMQDSKYLYFLLDLLPGGELMTILEWKGKLPEEWARFYSASVLLAFTEFHRHRIAYRDLKPENVVLDANGFGVVVDLGLAKQLKDGPTYTFCGTPDYIAPELISGTGYSLSVDLWALGVFLYELCSGSAPFQSYDPAGTAKKILKGRPTYPSNFSKQLRGVIKELLTKDPTRRLGCMSGGTDGAMKHRFYHGFDWQGMLERKIKPPFRPRVPKDVSTIGYKDDGTDDAEPTKWNIKL